MCGPLVGKSLNVTELVRRMRGETCTIGDVNLESSMQEVFRDS
jgi:hypothetical protein